MNITNRQAAIGAFVAMALMLGASASPDRGVQSSVLPYADWNIRAHESEAVLGKHIALVAIRACGDQAQFSPHDRDAEAYLAKAFETCGTKALSAALDTFAEVAAHLKQI